MPLSRVQYTGDGAANTFTVTFPYISTAYVQVRVNNVLQTVVTHYSFPSASSILFVTAPGATLIVDIRRVTPSVTRLVDFQDGAILTEQSLDLSADQTFHLTQENTDDMASRLALDTSGNYDALSKRIVNVANPVNAQDAAPKAWTEAITLTHATNAAASALASSNSANASSVSAAASAASYDSFDDRYLGAKTADPTLDNDGNALITGALYFNSTSNTMQVRKADATWGATVISSSSFIATLLDDADAATARTTLGAQTLDATLTALAGLATGADNLAYSTGADTFAQTALTSFARTLLDDASQATAATTLSGAPFLHQNDIINGDFRIAQAGTSFAAPASGAYDLDGWQSAHSSAAVFTAAQVAGSTTGRLARQVTITTADAAVAAGDYVSDATNIEGFNIEKYVGQTFTIAFRAKVPVTGIHCVALRNSGSDRAYIKEINFPTANAWQDCSFTVTGGLPTAGTWNYTTGVGLAIWFSHMVGTTYQTTPDAWNTGNFLATANQVNDCATVGNVWAMEKVTLNLGTVAAVSEISVEAELIRCQRYFDKGRASHRFTAAAAGNTGETPLYLHITMRDTPVMTIASGGIRLNATVTAQNPTVEGCRFQVVAVAAGDTYALNDIYTAAARL